MKLTYISTYPPRECGLATFNKSLINAINLNFSGNSESRTSVIALNAGTSDRYDYPDEVKYVINQQNVDDYIAAADLINQGDSDACILQHEFGIYGGDDGIYVLSFLSRLEKPLISIFHTVLERPTFQQKMILQNIAQRSDKVVVMGKIAINLLHKVYNIPSSKISYIEHGAPDLDIPKVNPVKLDKLFKGRKVLLTFGLISRNKGLETVIRALPKIAEKHPEVLYVILGATHPDIVRSSGEEYREYLLNLAERLDVSQNLAFINRFVSERDLIDYITAADIYVSPYLNEAQITSGTLAYAVGAGAAVVATPYWHAKEILADGRGRLFGFKDEKALASIVNELLGDPQKLQTIKNTAYSYGTNLRWPVIGRNYLKVIKQVIEKPDLGDRLFSRIIDPDIMPEFGLDYVKHLTNSTGIIQHAKYGIPNWKEGYCVDDNARALIMTLMAHQFGYDEALDLMPAYMSFLLYMQNDGGYFRNFLSYQNEYLDKIGSEDAFGRAIWALGYLVRYAPNSSYAKLGKELFHKALPNFKNLIHLRGISNTIIGISHYLKVHPSDHGLTDILQHMSNALINAYQNCHDKDWCWFEDHLTYDNAILPLALLHSADITKDEKALHTALDSMCFLEKATLTGRCYNPVGNNGWYMRDGEKPSYDQQAIDIMAMVLMYGKAYEVTDDAQYLKKLFFVYTWFLGENSLCVPLYDPETKGCCDGLHPHGINLNQGAESSLAYLISHLTVLQAFKTGSNLIYDKAEAMETVLFK